MKVQSAAGTSGPIAMPVAAAVPAIFTYDGSGSGAAAILNEDGSFNTPLNPAARRSIITFFAEGGGVMSPPMADGAVAGSSLPLPAPQLPLTVSIRGVNATVIYAGAAPNYVSGLLQIDVRVPDTVGFGNSLPLSISFGTFSSQDNITIAVLK
jgi:uncharacterized protein (TIGR03437 family)